MLQELESILDLGLVYDLQVDRAGGIAFPTCDYSRCDDLGINVIDPHDVPTSLTLMGVFPTGLKWIVLR